MAGEDHGPYTELYALLHVPRDAAEEDITRAYRHLASNYHPDKFPSLQMQDVAKDNFQRIRAAYEVLSDPGLRQVYDIYGPKGLQAGLELGPALRTRAELREQFERAEEQRREAQAAARTQHSSSLVLTVTAADFIASGMDIPPQVVGMQMSTQVQASLSPKDTVALGGSMLSRRGAAGGSMVIVARRQLTPLHSIEAVAAIGMRSLLTVTTQRQVSPALKATSSVALHLGEGVLGLTNSWALNFSEHSTGTLQWGLGPGAGLTAGWQREIGGKTVLNTEVKLSEGLGQVGGSAVLTRKFSEKTSGRLSLRLGTTAADVEVGGSRKVSENSAAGMSVLLGLQGVMWKVRYTRGGQKVTIPILLSRRLRPRLVLFSLLAPAAGVTMLKLWAVSPWAHQRRLRREQGKRAECAEAVQGAMEEARASQELMGASAERRRRQQEARNGLVITGALYGSPLALRAAGPGPPATPPDAAQEGGHPPVSPPADTAGVPSDESVQSEGPPGGDASLAARGEEGEATWRAWVSRGWGLLVAAFSEEGEEGEEEGGASGRSREEALLPPALWDVRIPLQFLVDEGGSLLLHRGVSKRGIMGSCDPCPGLPKQLRVWYKSGGKDHVVTVHDLDELRLPDPSHAIN